MSIFIRRVATTDLRIYYNIRRVKSKEYEKNFKKILKMIGSKQKMLSCNILSYYNTRHSPQQSTTESR